MNRLRPLAILAILMAMTLGCGRAPRYDQRLVQADSLMQLDPDSALAIVETISADSLTNEGDRAYCDLLLTQARYRCHITAINDSDINRALDHYRRHSGEREKLTRAYIYKGAVMDELGHPDSAMLYYKHAEASAAPNDYFNMGYVKARMGALYRDHFAIDGRDVQKYEEALDCYTIAGNSERQLMCMMNLGSLYRLKNPEKSESKLKEAMNLALQLQDTARYLRCKQFLIMTYYSQMKYQQACQLVKDVMEHSDDRNRLSVEFLATAAEVYARLGMPDSAERFLTLISNRPLNGVIDEMNYLECVREIALARGDTAAYRSIADRCKHMNDSLLKLDASIRITQAEDNIDSIFQQQVNRRYSLSIKRMTLAIIACLTILSIVIFLFYRRKHRYDRLIADLRNASETHITELAKLRDKLEALDIKDLKVKGHIDSYWTIIREIIDECNHAPNGNGILVEKIKNLIQNQGRNKDLWLQLNDYIDMRYNNIMSRTMKSCPQLNERDQILLALSTLDFSCAQIAIIMGYANPTSIGAIRQRLAQKMGLDCTLMQYISANVQK